jgi:hypothetical protein
MKSQLPGQDEYYRPTRVRELREEAERLDQQARGLQQFLDYHPRVSGGLWTLLAAALVAAMIGIWQPYFAPRWR